MTLYPLSFAVRCDYSRSPSHIEIPVSLKAGANTVDLLAKIDTGSTYCVFQREYGEQLGLVIQNGHLKSIVTAIGPFDAYGHWVAIEALDFVVESQVYFAAESGFTRNVLGLLGWIDRFRLAVIHHDCLLHVSPYDL